MTSCFMFFLLFLFTIFCFESTYCTFGNINGNNGLVCPEIEKQALLSFKQSLEDPSNLLFSWDISADVNCCNWKGVVCSNVTGGGHVHQLHLQNYDDWSQRFRGNLNPSGLRGKLNPSLVNLKHLRYLDLSYNHFEVTIPSFIGSLTSLEYLNLSYASFYGTIPHSIGNLSNLHTLNLDDGYYLYGYTRGLDVDNLEWLSRLTQLEHLSMNYVNLERAANWVQVINTLPSLVELHFSSCTLDLLAPLDDVNISTSLAILDLSGNINGSSLSIPRWIFQLSNLIYLDLSGNSFEGPIPTITNTTKLQHIDLSHNHFNSTIPDWLYSLKDLEFLDLSLNDLHGPIPREIANLTSLNTLRLSSNQLSGEIPRGIVHLGKIQTLDLSGNKLQGEISGSFGNMSDCFLGSLEYLDLSWNQLSGQLTAQFGEFKSLRTIDIADNNLSGAIPINLGKLSSLEYLILHSNKLSGNLPVSVGQLFNLKCLYISNNTLEGVVSEIHFANLTKLKNLYADRNHLTLDVSPNWIPHFTLEALTLGWWNLGKGAQIPTWIEKQAPTIRTLDLSYTGISGNVPSWISKIGSLVLSHNQLNGSIPVISDTQFIYLSYNQFTGSLPQVPADVQEIDLSFNSFSGGLSHFLCDETYSLLGFLHLDVNQLSGEIPDCWTKLSSLRYLNLGHNMFSGSIPNSIGLLARLQSLNLYNNRISGRIPFSMRNCTKLVNIDLGNNDLDGTIPTWIGTSLADLKILILRSNKLSGEISSDICHLNSLQILRISDNRFSGRIPKCVDNFTAMATKRSLPQFSETPYYFGDGASVATKGSELYYDINLPLVTNIDLSKNNFSGDIPKELTSLVELRSLDLSGNHFTGMIPQSIGDMKQLESLDLSRNYLSGEMPNSFRVMSSLNYLNVSHNHLRGRIPESTQIRGFDASSFIGNDDLCGPPLTSNCGSVGPKNKDDNGSDHHKSSFSKIEWVYVFMSLGYAVGLSVFCTTLILNKSWREAYYEFMEEMWNRVYVYFYIKWRKLTTKASV